MKSPSELPIGPVRPVPRMEVIWTLSPAKGAKPRFAGYYTLENWRKAIRRETWLVQRFWADEKPHFPGVEE